MNGKSSAIEKYIDKGDTPIRSTAKSKRFTSIPGLMRSQGSSIVKLFYNRAPVFPKMIGCLRESRKSASSITRNPKLGNTTISQEQLQELEAYIASLGVTQVGYTPVPQDLIFKNHCILYPNAIVLIMEMQCDKIATAPSKSALKEIFRTYYQLGICVNKIADFLRSRGFNAMAAPAIGGDVNYVPLAEKAGLGAMGRHGLLITEKSYGASLRIAAVYTDIENLPFATENPHKWIKQFCSSCGKCIRECPTKAIYETPLENGQCIEQARCADPFANNYGCTCCIRNCTFFDKEGMYDKLKTKFNK